MPPFYEQWGLSWLPLEKVLGVASPLAFSPLVPPERRFIFAGLADRWVRPGNVAALWEHWNRSAIHWFQGSHLSACSEPTVHAFVDEAVRRTLL